MKVTRIKTFICDVYRTNWNINGDLTMIRPEDSGGWYGDSASTKSNA